MHPPSPMLLRALRSAACQRAPCPSLRHPRLYRATLNTVSPHIRASSSSSKPSPPVPDAGTVSTLSQAADMPRGTRKGTDRGPPSEESTQTDFAALNVLGSSTPPSTAIDECLTEGFQLDNGMEIGGGSGCLLVQGEAFQWRPWAATEPDSGTAGAQRKGLPSPKAMLNAKGQWEVPLEAWGVLECVWPKPELLILGLGASMHPLSPATKHHINSLGIRLDIQDTRNAAAQFNLLATERGVSTVAAALIPIGWKGRR